MAMRMRMSGFGGREAQAGAAKVDGKLMDTG